MYYSEYTAVLSLILQSKRFFIFFPRGRSNTGGKINLRRRFIVNFRNRSARAVQYSAFSPYYHVLSGRGRSACTANNEKIITDFRRSLRSDIVSGTFALPRRIMYRV